MDEKTKFLITKFCNLIIQDLLKILHEYGKYCLMFFLVIITLIFGVMYPAPMKGKRIDSINYFNTSVLSGSSIYILILLFLIAITWLIQKSNKEDHYIELGRITRNQEQRDQLISFLGAIGTKIPYYFCLIETIRLFIELFKYSFSNILILGFFLDLFASISYFFDVRRLISNYIEEFVQYNIFQIGNTLILYFFIGTVIVSILLGIYAMINLKKALNIWHKYQDDEDVKLQQYQKKQEESFIAQNIQSVIHLFGMTEIELYEEFLCEIEISSRKSIDILEIISLNPAYYQREFFIEDKFTCDKIVIKSLKITGNYTKIGVQKLIFRILIKDKESGKKLDFETPEESINVILDIPSHIKASIIPLTKEIFHHKIVFKLILENMTNYYLESIRILYKWKESKESFEKNLKWLPPGIQQNIELIIKRVKRRTTSMFVRIFYKADSEYEYSLYGEYPLTFSSTDSSLDKSYIKNLYPTRKEPLIAKIRRKENFRNLISSNISEKEKEDFFEVLFALIKLKISIESYGWKFVSKMEKESDLQLYIADWMMTSLFNEVGDIFRETRQSNEFWLDFNFRNIPIECYEKDGGSHLHKR
ncbi:MAG: hypothetical protein ACFE9L_05765 [Candidatus Hodarchaeota archaeon]